MEKDHQKNQDSAKYPFTNELSTFMVSLICYRVYVVAFQSLTPSACNLEVQEKMSF